MRVQKVFFLIRRPYARRQSRWISFLILLLALPARAEYRVYELEISDSTNGAVRIATTTLDDIQYRFYNSMKLTERVAIKETWMCYQRSDYFKGLCPKPPPPPPRPPKPAKS